MKWYQKLRSWVFAGNSQAELVGGELEIAYAYFLYYIYGAACFSERVPHTLKFVYCVYNAFLVIVCLICAPTYYLIIQLRNSSPNTREYLEVSVTLGVIAIATSCPLFPYYFRETLEAILAYFEKKNSEFTKIDAENANTIIGCTRQTVTGRYVSDSHQSSDIQGIERVNVIKVTLVAQMYLVVCEIAYLVSPVITLLLLRDGPPNLIQYHVIPIPFYDCMIIQRIYYLVLAVEVLLTVPLAILCSVPSSMLVILAALMNNSVHYFCQRIRSSSAMITKCFRNGYSFDGEVYESVRLTDFHEERAKDLRQLVRDYQDITQHVNEIRPFININCTLLASGTFLYQLGAVYLILGTKEPNSVKLRSLDLVITVTLFIFLVGYVGKSFHDMNDAVRYEVYNVPWYNLNVKTQQVVHIFQTMVLKDWKFHILTLYPISMSLAVSFLKSVFSFFNILRSIVNKDAK